jgi:hypothetical protein
VERFSLQAFELDGVVGAVALDGAGIALRLREWPADVTTCPAAIRPSSSRHRE